MKINCFFPEIVRDFSGNLYVMKVFYILIVSKDISNKILTLKYDVRNLFEDTYLYVGVDQEIVLSALVVNRNLLLLQSVKVKDRNKGATLMFNM